MHHIPPIRFSHAAFNALVGSVLPPKGGKADVEKHFEELRRGKKLTHKTYAGTLSGGQEVSVVFNLVDGSVFVALKKEVD